MGGGRAWNRDVLHLDAELETEIIESRWTHGRRCHLPTKVSRGSPPTTSDTRTTHSGREDKFKPGGSNLEWSGPVVTRDGSSTAR